MAIKKTNAARILDDLQVAYRLVEYLVDEEHLDAVSVAQKVGMPPEQVFKTLCVRGDAIPVMFAVIPGNGELNLKALAMVSGNKRCELVALKELLPLTGYIRGGCSPIGAKKNYPVFMDETCFLWDEIAISAGKRGLQIVVNPEMLVKAIDIKIGNLQNKNRHFYSDD
ncbi:MAG: Cys-tRNA(Pro) deacylase [Acidaminococcaceae bacterium]|nr:Cys-tRNA(Pro) deacylase [Acidaminococcaceae bacterium]